MENAAMKKCREQYFDGDDVTHAAEVLIPIILQRGYPYAIQLVLTLCQMAKETVEERESRSA
jgi:hypothetical protein